ncbi:MAG: hypothetical protein AAF085_13665, partial [Planctomycetota bacterium]
MNKEELAKIRQERKKMFQEIQHAGEDFMIPWTQMSPEEYVARQWHTVGSCSLHRYTYDDEGLNIWMKRFSE